LYKISLSHYYKHPSGDMIPNPDMSMQIDTVAQTAETLAYQDIYRYEAACVEGVIDQAVT